MKTIKLESKDILMGCQWYDEDTGTLVIRTEDDNYSLLFKRVYDDYYALSIVQDLFTNTRWDDQHDSYDEEEQLFDLKEIELITPCGNGNVISFKIIERVHMSKDIKVVVFNEPSIIKHGEKTHYLSKRGILYCVCNWNCVYRTFDMRDAREVKTTNEIKKYVKFI